MTVIIALKHNGNNYLAADCRTTAGHELVNDSSDKILVHNGCLIGLAGDVSIVGIIKRILNDNKKLKITNEINILDIYLKIRQIAKEHNLLDIGDYPSVQGLFVTDKHIWELCYDGAVLEHESKGFIGCGASLAQGIMEGLEITNPEEALTEVIKKVSKHSVGVSPNSIIKIPTPVKLIKKILKKSKAPKKTKTKLKVVRKVKPKKKKK